MTTLFEPTPAWKEAFPNAHAGVLAIRNAINPRTHPALEERKATLEQDLRARWQDHNRAAISLDPILQAYQSYYRSFKKTYHVQLQLESIVHKNKSLPRVSALVDAMFMAELGRLLLTAGHDLDVLQLPLRLHVSQGGETYTLLRGETQTLKPGDMYIADRAGILSSIIYGPDQRTPITAQTRNVIYTTYAPNGIPAKVVEVHLQEIRQYVQLVSPEAEVELLEVFSTG